MCAIPDGMNNVPTVSEVLRVPKDGGGVIWQGVKVGACEDVRVEFEDAKTGLPLESAKLRLAAD